MEFACSPGELVYSHILGTLLSTYSQLTQRSVAGVKLQGRRRPFLF